MAMGPVITRGFGSWGSAALVITRGYAIGPEIVAEITPDHRIYNVLPENRTMAISSENRILNVGRP